MESHRGFVGGFVGCCSFPEWCPISFSGSVLTMAETCAPVKMLWSNEQLHFCVTFLLWNKRFWVRKCPFEPSSVSKCSSYVSAFYTRPSNPCDRTVWSLHVKGADLMKSHVPSTSNFVTSCWTTELSPLREIGHPWTSRVFRIVQTVLQLFCFSFASGELCDEVINHCVPDLNPCQHESKCVPLDKGTR